LRAALDCRHWPEADGEDDSSARASGPVSLYVRIRPDDDEHWARTRYVRLVVRARPIAIWP